MIAVAILAGTLWTAREFRKAGRNSDAVWEALPWVLIFGVVGARAYHVAHLWAYYSTDLIQVLAVWNGGLGIYGGIIGGVAGLGAYLFFSNRKSQIANLKSITQISKIALIPWLNLAAPGLALGQAIGRAGNIANRELLPFAWYEMVWDLVIFVVLVNCKKGSNATNLLHKLTTNGKIICGLFVKEIRGVSSTFVLYLFLYDLGRVFLEFTRTDKVWRLGGFDVAQIISLGIIAITIILVLLRRRSFTLLQRRKNEPMM